MTNKVTETYLRIKADALKGLEIIPMFYQPIMGRSNAVSSAIRILKKEGTIIKSGIDGLGKPVYSLPLSLAG